MSIKLPITINPIISFCYFFIISIFISEGLMAKGIARDTITLEGNWHYQLLGAPPSIPGEGLIKLPNTLDNARKSVYNPESDNTTQLRHEFSFQGRAIYSRNITIPERWNGKKIELKLERTKPSVIKIDGEIIGSNSRISSPQRYNLTKYLTPGEHKIEITVNNADSLPPVVSRSSHAASESTQTNWNGILGEMLLEAKNQFHIERVFIKEDLYHQNIAVTVVFSGEAPKNMSLNAYLGGRQEKSIKVEKGVSKTSFNISIDQETKLWNPNSPNLINLKITLNEGFGDLVDEYEIITGIREFSADGSYFNLNGNPVFLRGTVNAAVFPATAFAPIDLKSWLDYFHILKQYGFNHVRFHSWTPPEAAFYAADLSGILIQTELPMWGELDRDLIFTNKFLKEDLEGIIDEYSHHPSFVMFSTGNELWGDISLMGEYMLAARTKNPRILSTYGSNVYLGMNGEIGGEDFLVAAKTSEDIKNSVRGSVSFADSSTGGHFNSTAPNSKSSFAFATEKINVPIVAHETGQYQSYPDFSEISSYSGSLKPDNFLEFKKRAIEAGTYRKNKAFAEASGKWAAELYKAEMEMSQRSSGIAGYQLFGLQDYPGQGTSLIGILDPFMNSKNFVTPEEWRQSCGDALILAELPAFTFTEGETVEIPIVTVNYTQNPDTIGTVDWQTRYQKGKIETMSGFGTFENDPIILKLPKVEKPEKITLDLSGANGNVTNSYQFYVYPGKQEDIENVFVTDNLDETIKLLKQGERVLFCPDSATSAAATIDPLFVNDFWNYRMYRTICDEMGLKPSPGTLGLYVNDNHPSLLKFPTDNHTDWQWYQIVTNSRPLVIDRLPKDFDPIIEVIDNVERNFRLAMLLECNVGKGKLIILSADLKKLSTYPEGRWFLQSVKEYLGSKDCKPEFTLTTEQVENLVTKPSTARLVKELKNETYNSRWD